MCLQTGRNTHKLIVSTCNHKADAQDSAHPPHHGRQKEWVPSTSRPAVHCRHVGLLLLKGRYVLPVQGEHSSLPGRPGSLCVG